MNQSITIGLAALLVGGAGGFIIGNTGGEDAGSTAEGFADGGVKLRRDSSLSRDMDSASRRSRASSLEEIMRQPGQASRIQGLIDLYSGMSAEELAAEAAKLDSLPMGDRILASMLLFSRWGELDPLGALDHTKTMGMAGMFAKPTILRSWASVDPVNAANYYSENASEFADLGRGRGPGGTNGAEAIAREWAKLDPTAALEWAYTLEGRDQQSALVSVVSELATTDPSKAASLAASFDEDDQQRAYSEIAEQWALQDFESAEAWIATLEGDAKQSALASAIDVLAKSDPLAAADMISGMDSGRSRDQAIEDVAQAWAATDPEAAAAWLVEQETGDMEDAMRQVMMNWSGSDSEAALSFIESQPEGEARDAAASTYLWMNRDAEPQESLALAETISDDRDRTRAIAMSTRQWMEEDEASARAYIESSTALSDEAKERILSGDTGRGRGGRR
ncbi:MAG: hypothetical protein ACQKBU_06150 [Verrucomicrobiales bacterium]